jgi:hypothetical protein
MSTIVESLTKDIVSRDLRAEGAALLNKWEKTGLLEGLDNDRTKNSMAVLLENQAKELLREASSMAAGDVEGFAAVAFPIVRRVFGGLIANELVSVQPMSLPSGLIFFLDFTFSNARGAGYDQNASVYGGNVTGSQITGGVDLGGGATTGDQQQVEDAPYYLNSNYSSPTGTFGNITTATGTTIGTAANNAALTDAQKTRLRHDPDLLKALADESTHTVIEIRVEAANVDSTFPQLNKDNLIGIDFTSNTANTVVLRRLTRLESNGDVSFILYRSAAGAAKGTLSAGVYPLKDDFIAGNGVGSVSGDPLWGLEGAGNTAGTFDGSSKDVIPEIDIRVESVAVTAMTKKLKAKWTPELAQDLNAYHNLDAEVELTSILSEQIALEIDQEILNDLIIGAKAGKLYWSRRPGKFVDRESGVQVGATSAAPDFTGTVSEWYETLVETINDVSARIHRKTLRGGANFLVCSPEVANLLEFTAGFRAAVSVDELKGGIVGAVKTGALSKKFDVFVDPYFPRNVVLVGRRGGSFLESGYVYAPYVPLQVTPTIFGVEDFVPRKGVMTRYAKKMVRPDMYGLVICQDLVG